MKKTWLRVLGLLARGYVLYQTNAEGRGRPPYAYGLDFGSSDGIPHPDKVYVSPMCNKWLRDAGYVAVRERHEITDKVVDYVWSITKQGLLAAKQGG